MVSEIRVERRFHFSCSCGATTVSGESTIACRGCGRSLAVRRVRKQQRVPGSSAYYGVALPAHQPETGKVDSSTKHRPAQICDFVRVSRLKPDRITPHPHAGAVGQVKDIFNVHAHIVVVKNGERHSICVSVSCLEVLTRAEWPQMRRFQARSAPPAVWPQTHMLFACNHMASPDARIISPDGYLRITVRH